MLKQLQPKECKIENCDRKKWANLNICYVHYRAREKAKREEKAQRKKERKELTKKFQLSLRKKLHKKAWSLISYFVRRSAANWQEYAKCYTCGVIKQWKEQQCGHFHHDKLDFDLRNLKPQCVQCNKFKSGNLSVYAFKLVQEIGHKEFVKLAQDATSHQGYSTEDLKAIIEEYENKTINILKINP